MKKFLIVIITIIFILSLAGCSASEAIDEHEEYYGTYIIQDYFLCEAGDKELSGRLSEINEYKNFWFATEIVFTEEVIALILELKKKVGNEIVLTNELVKFIDSKFAFYYSWDRLGLSIRSTIDFPFGGDPYWHRKYISKENWDYEKVYYFGMHARINIDENIYWVYFCFDKVK